MLAQAIEGLAVSKSGGEKGAETVVEKREEDKQDKEDREDDF